MAALNLRGPVETKIALGAIASILMLASLGWLSYSTIDSLVTTEKWVAHSHEVIGSLESGLALLTDAETKERGYLLTGDQGLLARCKEDQAQIAGWSRQIQALTVDNPQAQQGLASLDKLITAKMALLNSRLEHPQHEGVEITAADREGIHQGEALTDSIQKSFADLRAKEAQLLVQRQNAAQANANICQIIVLSGSTLACVVGVIAYFLTRHDLRLRAKAQRELSENQGLLESILDNTPALVFIKDLSGRYLFVNRRFCEIAGRPRSEIAGKTAFDISRKELAQQADVHFQTILKTGLPVEVEEIVQYQDGARAHLAVKFPVRDAAGQLCAVAGISTDITARKQIERMQLQFQTLFESAPGLYIVLRPDFTIVAASDAYLKATMTKREVIMGRGIFDVFPDNPGNHDANGAANLQASLNQVLKTGETDTMAIQRYDVRRPDGIFEERYWSPINSAICGSDGQVEFIIHRVEDVTQFIQSKPASENSEENDLAKRLERMEAEIFRSSQEVKAANEQLRLANKELEAFSYSVSHDLRAPLRHIDGFVDLLRKQAFVKLNDRERRHLDVIANAARQMGSLIDDLLVFSRMSRVDLRRVKVASNSLLDEAIHGAQMELNGRQVEWKIAMLPEVEADPAMLRQVWMNLVNNAAKYTRPRKPGQIEVGCEDAGEEWVFFVRDNGVGFDMQYVHKLFGVFQRLHRSDEFEGTGIGLANVRRIVSRHGGRTWAEGKLDIGATFYFSLPKHK